MNRREFVKNMFSLAAAPVVLQAASKLPAPEKLAECKDDAFPASQDFEVCDKFDISVLEDIKELFERNYVGHDERWMIVSPDAYKLLMQQMPLRVRVRKRIIDIQKILTGYKAEAHHQIQGISIIQARLLDENQRI